MIKNFLVLFVVIICSVFLVLPLRVYALTANITSLIFTTTERTVGPGEVSDSIIVQTSNASGVAEKVDETNDVTFTSTSATGQFLNSTGNAVSTTMNNNTASRTFFYSDANAGTYSITVSVKGRTTGTIFSASQSIVVGTSVSEPQSTATSTTSTSVTSNTSVQSSSSNTVSSHSSTEDIYNFSATPTLKTDAGRDRIVAVNSPIEFEAKTNESSSNQNSGISVEWSFGDGMLATGKIVSHTYAFPGNYNVVLNTTTDSGHAVSRTRVKVITPEVSIVDVKVGVLGYVEIKNNSKDEVNLQHWKLSGGNQTFFFVVDTIISPNSSIKFPFAFSGEVENIILSYPNGIAISNFGKNSQVATDYNNSEIIARRVDAEKRTNDYVYNSTYSSLSPANTVSDIETEDLLETGDLLQTVSEEASSSYSSDQTASLVEAFKSVKEDSDIVSSFLKIPSRALNFLHRIFVW